jgi:hypothetical protein
MIDLPSPESQLDIYIENAKNKESISFNSLDKIKKKTRWKMYLLFPDSLGKPKLDIPPPEQVEPNIYLLTSESQFDIYIRKNKKNESNYWSSSSWEKRLK